MHGDADVVVVGGGISGASFAFEAQRLGRSAVVLEASDEVGGALATVQDATGFWFELGAHTLYNSYGATIELIEAAGLRGALRERGAPVLRFVSAGQGTGRRVGRAKNLGAVLSRMSILELMTRAPAWLGRDGRSTSDAKSVAEHYGRLFGTRNYRRFLGPMISAISSQPADAFPSDVLFKKRSRRGDVPRSFTIEGGVRRLVEGLLEASGADVRVGQPVATVSPDGAGVEVALSGGDVVRARHVALAVSPRAAAALLSTLAPDAARVAGEIAEAEFLSLGVRAHRDAVRLPECSYLIPTPEETAASGLRSMVSRDVLPDPAWRGFTFHFERDAGADQRIAVAEDVLGVERSRLWIAPERRGVLPSLRTGHAVRARALDAALVGTPAAVTGNWFGGLAIEDCVVRSRAEARRLFAD